MKKKTFFIAIIGNILEHYDTALFGLLAPYFAPLFFPDKEYITALIYTYAMAPIGIFCRPLGAFFFGAIGDLIGRKQAFSLALFGTALSSFLIGCLPAGAWISPWLLCLCRMLQNFFLAGEVAGGAVFLLERSEPSQKNFMSSLYSASTIVGILLASLCVFFLGKYGDLKELWRYPFFFTSLTAIIGCFARFTYEEKKATVPFSFKAYVKEGLKEKSSLVPIIFAAGFSYCTYTFAFPLLNAYLPLACSIPKQQAIAFHTWFLGLDLLLLPVFGFMANRISKEALMGGSALLLGALAPILFFFLKEGGIYAQIALQATVVVLGTAFASTYQAWTQERAPEKIRYSFASLGYAVGTQLIGLPSIAVSLWLYQKTGWIWSPSIYLSLAAFAAAMSVFGKKYLLRRTAEQI